MLFRSAKSLQIPEALHAPNGSMVRLAPGVATIFDEAPSGRIMLDGNVLTGSNGPAMKERRGLAYAGIVAVTILRDARGRPAGDPVVICAGLPEEVADAAREAAFEAQGRLGRRGEDDTVMAEDVRRFVRRAVQDSWGKKPLVKVEVSRVG